MNIAIAFLIGLIAGFVIEWAVDFLLLRRKTRRLESELNVIRQEKAILEEQLYPVEPEPELEEATVESEVQINQEEETEFEAVSIDSEPAVELEDEEQLPINEEVDYSRLAEAGLVAAAVLSDDEQGEEAEPSPSEQEADEIFLPVGVLDDETESVSEINPVSTEDTEWIFEETTPEAQPDMMGVEGAKFKQDIEFIEGVGPAYGTRLREIGIETPQDLLEQGATARGRDEITEQTGIPGALILGWVNQVDLYRIKGVGSEYAELLKTAGVNTVLELANRNPNNLFQKINEINSEFQRVRQLPSLGQVNDWIDQAKSLPRIVSY